MVEMDQHFHLEVVCPEQWVSGCLLKKKIITGIWWWVGQEDSAGEVPLAQFPMAGNGGDSTDGWHERGLHVWRWRFWIHPGFRYTG